RLEVIHTNTDRQKISTINHLAQAHDGSGIIYTTTRKAVEHVAEELQWNGLTVAAYHAGMKDSVRIKAQEDFMKGKTQMIVATNAFGMGIDKPDIRFVVHYQMPGSIEAYYQEIGRAGRDGLTSSCVLLFNYADKNTHDFFIDGSYPSSQTVKDVYQALVATGLKRIELTVPELARRADAKNEMSVQSALYLLERAGHIVRSDASDRRETATHRKRSIVMLDATPTKNLRVNFRDVERRADIERAKLREMIDLCYSEYCYRADVLNYFGDRHHAQRCGMCGNCVPHTSPRMKFEHEAKSSRSKTGKRTTVSIPARPITAAENLCARKILACAARMGGRFGKNMLISTLRGSAAQNIMEAKLNELSTYGLLREMRKEEVLLYVEALLDARCLKITGSEYPMVSTTELGQRVMREQEQVELRLPAEGDAVESETRFRPAKTAFETLALFQQGLSTEEIARRRELVAGTIEAHLTDCLRAGFPVDTSRLVAAEDRKEILQAIAIHGTERLKPIKESLPERIRFNAIRFVVVEHQLREKQKASAAK
ncbi:MAG TPA: helix-turn-helix domain-containing protein, partial [Pyrinomonadaceae bacterium]